MPFKRDQEQIDRLKQVQERVQAKTKLALDSVDPALKTYFGIEAEETPAERRAADRRRLLDLTAEEGAAPGRWPPYRGEEHLPPSEPGKTGQVRGANSNPHQEK